MKDLFLPHDLCLLLKKLGFTDMCFYWWNADGVILESCHNKNSESWLSGDNCSCILPQQAFDWFIKNYNLEGTVMSWKENGKIVWYYSAETVGEPNRYKSYECNANTKREAEIACVHKLISNLKN